MYGKTIYGGLLLIACTACHTNTSNSHPTGTDSLLTNTTHTDNCYQRLDGNAQQDTATVHLVIDDTLVTGAMVVKIAEKDTRAGILRGSVHNNMIRTWWHYTQEGMADSLPANFKLENGKLWAQRYGYDPANGRETLSDTSAFALAFTPVACKLPLQ